MSSKYSQEQKMAAVQAYIKGEGGIRQIARSYDVSRGALIQWVAHFKQNGSLPEKTSEKENLPFTVEKAGPEKGGSGEASAQIQQERMQFKLQVLYWQQVHEASDLKTAVTFKLKGMEIVSKWRKFYLQGGKLRLIRTQDGNIKTIPKTQTKVIVKVKKENALENKAPVPSNPL